MPDNTLSTLTKIREKVRKLTRSPSTAQISDASIDEYVNTFILYDFPEHIRLFYFRTTLTFYTKPYIDTYTNNTTDPNDPLYNFKNKYTSIHTPTYIAGYQAFYSQSREQFFGIYPMVNAIASIGSAGDGVTTFFMGTLAAKPVLQNNVTFSSVNTVNNPLVLVDVPTSASLGNLCIPNSIAPSYGTIDYIAGTYSFNFPSAPKNGAAINSMTVPYVASRPQAILYYQNTLTIRPVPDQPYPISVEAYIRPTELLSAGDMPEMSDMFQYISYGAAKKIFEDRMDPESVQIIMPEFLAQEDLIRSKTISIQSNQRSATIYTEQTGLGTVGNGLGFSWGGGSF